MRFVLPWPEAGVLPGAPARADMAACRRQLAQGSRSFLLASRLLPAAVREPACGLYAFCRMADDAVDGQPDPSAAVQMLQARLLRVYAPPGSAEPPAALEDRVLARVVREHGIPPALLEALIEGFAWDAQGRRYDTLDDLLDYAARVAGSVGAMMAVLMGARSGAALARAADLGVAMQLSNIARDVGEDAAMGRLYLPRQWLHAAGLDPEAWLKQPRHGDALAGVVRQLLDEAERLYDRAEAGLALLPPACRPGIALARRLYREIGREVRRRGHDGVSARAVVGQGRRLWQTGAALGACLHTSAQAAQDLAGLAALPPLPATAYLVQAVHDWPAPMAPPGPPGWWQVPRRAERTLALFERLARQDLRRPRWR